MPFLESTCPRCQRPATIVDTCQIDKQSLHTLACGHFVYADQIIGFGKTPEGLVSYDHKRLMRFQTEGVRFINASHASIRVSAPGFSSGPKPITELSGVRCLIADEMGLGKTVQALGWLATSNAKRTLFVVNSSLKIQWHREILRWIDDEKIIQIVGAASECLIKCDGYIITYDLLHRIENLPAKMAELKVRTMVIDECQQIKNEKSQRAIAVRQLSRQMDNVIALSGTPIKNNAGEYWCALNVLRPDIFPSAEQYRMRDCRSSYSGYGWKTQGLNDPEAFRDKTKAFIIRRTRDEVMPDLPKVFRTYKFDDLGSEVRAAYSKAMKDFQEAYEGKESAMNQLAIMSRLRHLTGISKVRPTVEHVEEFLEAHECKKPLVVFYHHQDVGEFLRLKLDKVLARLAEEFDSPPQKCLMFVSELSSEERQALVDDFRNGKSPIMLASTLAAKEGTNLQFCDEFVIMERQWNPANEEQAEGRFPRIGSLAVSIQGTYFVAVNTIDEYFAEIVERKRSILAATLDGKEIEWQESSIMQELAERLAGATGWRMAS